MMQVTNILKALPASLEWMVLFKLSALRPLTDLETIRAMFHLPSTLDMSGYSHVVLANTGHFLASEGRSHLMEVVSGHTYAAETTAYSLYDRFQAQLSRFPTDEADCLGLGETAPYPPVLLHITLQDGVGHAQATFAQVPSLQGYELLQVIGVTFLGGTDHGNTYVAQFQNRLPVHIHAGILSHFSRTAHCNLFFLHHGNITPEIKQGLLQAAIGRINWAREQSLKALTHLSEQAQEQSLAMVCQPPLPEPPFPYGDLVPLGFVARALQHATNVASPEQSPAKPEWRSAYQQLERFLISQQQQGLWAFHRDRLITATDSALVLQGLHAPEAIAALEQFADGKGGYYPQLWALAPQPHRMVVDPQCRHWCQPDFATTCAVAALRKEAHLPPKTSLDYFADRFEQRSGLYFANPYLVDWMLARALPEEARPLRQTLATEILASRNPDYTFGRYDQVLSTALAILSLAALGVSAELLIPSQIALLNARNPQGAYPVAAPFYSSLRIDQTLSKPELNLRLLQNGIVASALSTAQNQIRVINGEYHAISLYWDTQGLISTALVTLALAESGDRTKQRMDLDIGDRTPEVGAAHPRYQCAKTCDYIANMALPQFLHNQF